MSDIVPNGPRYITKYAMTSGITHRVGVLHDNGMFVVPAGTGGMFDTYFHGNDHHETWEDALARVEIMRMSKLRSLSKQTAKIKGLVFKDPATQ